MFKFARILSGPGKTVDTLYLQDEYIGSLGYDEGEGLWIKTRKDLTVVQISLLITQLISSNPAFAKEKLEIIKIKEDGE